MTKKAYMEQGLDIKRLVLVMGKKFWLIIAGMLAGALLGAVTYKTVTGVLNGETEYRASADYYITFNFDEFEHGDDYYNAYTWDGILRDDPIVDYALSVLPKDITKDMVKAAVTGEMLGDYRILTVHVTTSLEERTNLIAEAYQKSLVHFGEEIELLDKIEVWSQEDATVLEKNTKTGNAAFLGGLLGFLLVFFLELFYYVLEAAVYVEKDAKEMFGLPVYGIVTRENDSLQKQMLENNLEFVTEGKEYQIWNGECIPQTEDYEVLRKASCLIIEIPWGRNNGRQILRLLEQLEIQDCDVKGMIITQADDVFVKSYYAIERNRYKK